MIHKRAIRTRVVRLRLLTFAIGATSLAMSLAAPVAAKPSVGATNPTAPTRPLAGAFDLDAWDPSAVDAIDSDVFELALKASRCAIAAGAVRQPANLTIIDYSKASVEPRLWVLDLQSRKLLYEELVSHGQGSGGNFATRFSNVPDSHQTSIGLFVTDDTYVGRNGYSLRLDGLEKGFNDRARERAIVMHGAPYVNGAITRTLGRLGRSHGCPAVREAVAHELLNRVKGGNLVFSYYPDQEWLRSSRYLGTCGS
jgi:hypothetical protein